KGISQIIVQIDTLNSEGFDFDLAYSKLNGKNIIVYPIICHNESYFSMPGVTEYLQRIFSNQLNKNISERLKIKPITLINVEYLFNYALQGGNFGSLKNLIDTYQHIIENRVSALKKQADTNSFLRSKSSFDEFYWAKFGGKLKNAPNMDASLKQLIQLTHLMQSEIDETL